MSFAIQSVLRKFGLSQKEIFVYVSCLELGSAHPVSVIARKASINRSTTYNILNELLDRGLISRFVKGKVQHYSPLPPDSLVEFLEQKENLLHRHLEELRGILPKLRSLSFRSYSVKPKVVYLEGEKNLKSILLESLKAESVSFYCPVDEWLTSPLSYFLADYFRKAFLDKKIFFRTLIQDTEIARNYLQKLYPKNIPSQFQFTSCIPFHSLIIYENKIGFLLLSKEKMSAIIIEDKEVFLTQKNIFDFFWDYES